MICCDIVMSQLCSCDKCQWGLGSFVSQYCKTKNQLWTPLCLSERMKLSGEWRHLKSTSSPATRRLTGMQPNTFSTFWKVRNGMWGCLLNSVDAFLVGQYEDVHTMIRQELMRGYSIFDAHGSWEWCSCTAYELAKVCTELYVDAFLVRQCKEWTHSEMSGADERVWPL